ncbi:MAG: DoxX protein [Flavipsychrobacter sp.]|jgi:hypothetical protein|nr:DoxX protein [Flavipsychrobacter sp.]
MNRVFRLLLILFSVATGALFLYSAYTKLFPTIQAFEYNIAGNVGVTHIIAAIAARFFIGLEAGLGIMITSHFFGRRNWVLKLAFAMVAVFSVYLIWLWVKMGNNVNCGCFGGGIFMSPSTSLIKNAIILGVLGVLIRYHKGFSFDYVNAIPLINILCLIVLAFLQFPVFTHYKFKFDKLYADSTYAPKQDLKNGKHIVAFVSRSCSHCRKAASIMHNMKQKNPTLPFYMVVAGTDTAFYTFWQETHAQDIPWSLLPEKTFMEYTGGEFPQILWLNDGKVEANTTYPELDQKVIEDWMKAPNP